MMAKDEIKLILYTKPNMAINITINIWLPEVYSILMNRVAELR